MMMASACSSMSFWLPNIDDEVTLQNCFFNIYYTYILYILCVIYFKCIYIYCTFILFVFAVALGFFIYSILMLLYKASIFNDNIEKLLKMTPQAVSSLGLGQISEYDDAHFHHSTQWPMIVKKKNTLTLPHPWLMPCKNWGAPELNDVGGSCKSFAACWKLKPPGRRRKSLAKPPICIVTSHFFCWKPHSILDPPSAGTPFQWSSLLQLLETSLWSFSGQNSCPCPDLLQLIYIIIPSLCIWIWPHHNWIRFLWSACNRGSSGLRISEFWGFQWQTLAEILSLFVEKVNLFF